MLSFEKAIDLVRNVTHQSVARPDIRTVQGHTWQTTDSNTLDAPASKQQRRRFVKPGVAGFEAHIHRRRFGRRLFHISVTEDSGNVNLAEKNEKEDTEVSSFSMFMRNVNEPGRPDLLNAELSEAGQNSGNEDNYTMEEVDVDSPIESQNEFTLDPSIQSISLKRSCRGSRNLLSHSPNFERPQAKSNALVESILACPDLLEDHSSDSDSPDSCAESRIDTVSLLVDDDDDDIVETAFQKVYDPDFDRLTSGTCRRKPQDIKISYDATDDNLVTFLGGFRGHGKCTRKVNRSGAIRGNRRKMTEERRCSFEFHCRLNEAFDRIPLEFRDNTTCHEKGEDSIHVVKIGCRSVTFDSQPHIRYFEVEDTSISQ
uniref:AlNc14C48G3830 protein n=1 Tax=Albugo laibachii Nc14 TaxID=890382 RepID=F0WAW9_9STRA|nr:AlNc14C48G3830 [Albugo laibachii Nc14]CCA18435.1 AlNc14C50G3959 [Albugo laibachii Nc14]|eukprot:CCA18435.1 AlNc14C50G3959 [Albugo laibachii Nc14]